MTARSLVHAARNVSLAGLAVLTAAALWLAAPSNAGSRSDDGAAATAPSVAVDGAVRVVSEHGVITRVVVPVTVRGASPIALPDDQGGLHVETALSESATAAVPATYSFAWNGGNGDRNLDPGERAELTVILPERSSIRPGNPLRIVINSTPGVRLVVEGVIR